ncbi:TPA: hypothetical protein N0F65_009614 [Lagenidium giganteum]|uniref:Protein kinase domain-containing protein n=1 Tax=Lagenidium giganteum TaxID=4803 RepID=A0AAV2YRZ9_9STRA|nr:TPA: hypothetical protein N0F65_009614 [Lagenidium giganteum]
MPDYNVTPSHVVPIVLATVGGVLTVCALLFLLYRRWKTQTSSLTEHVRPSEKFTSSLMATMLQDYPDAADSSSIWNDPTLQSVRIDFRAIEMVRMVWRGGFGEVWQGLLMGERVAVKQLSDRRTLPDAMAFASEVSSLDHPRIVRFIGVAWNTALSIRAVTEFMDSGDLRCLLESDRAATLTWASLKCRITIDVSDALVYLHTLTPSLIHRDLKSRNILIDSNRGAKLSDFGVARQRSIEQTMAAGVGTTRWMAPEVILDGHYTESADIYSLGVVLSELDSCQLPYSDARMSNGSKMQDVAILQRVSAGKLQPSFSSGCPPPMLALARACLSIDPAARPSAIQVS